MKKYIIMVLLGGYLCQATASLYQRASTWLGGAPQKANTPVLQDDYERYKKRLAREENVYIMKLRMDKRKKKAAPTPIVDIRKKYMDDRFLKSVSADLGKPQDVLTVKRTMLKLLDTMPDETLIHIPLISGFPCPKTLPDCWQELLMLLGQHSPMPLRKIIRVDKLQVGTNTQDVLPLFTDIIIDQTQNVTTVFYKNANNENPTKMDFKRVNWSDRGPLYKKTFMATTPLTKDYMSIYEQLPEGKQGSLGDVLFLSDTSTSLFDKSSFFKNAAGNVSDVSTMTSDEDDDMSTTPVVEEAD